MKKVIILFILFVASYRTSMAQIPSRPAVQANIPQQSVYFELGGNGIIYSLNYDLLFESNWGFRIGGSFFPADFTDADIVGGQKENSRAFIGILMGQYSMGNTPHKLELGAGLLYGTIFDRNNWDYIEPPGFTSSIGYRYLPVKPKHVTFKAAFTPVINRSGFHPRIGISIGILLSADDTSGIQNR